jgi:hypothetical protein
MFTEFVIKMTLPTLEGYLVDYGVPSDGLIGS